ncbi:MAG: FAD-binding protein [Bacteroidales bacterium]|nr:FAD-binding protein [Bacteroidales bacterium]
MYKRLIISGLMKTVSNYPIPNTFRMKVKCALYVEIESEEELAALDFASLPQPVMVMGGGSNLLFTKDFPGTVLHYGVSSALDQVQGIFGPGAISGAGPGPSSVPLNALEATVGGPGPGDKITPGPKSGWTRSTDGADVLVSISAGTVFDDFCAWAAAEGLWGPENLSLIPGECGASAVQNIGAYGVEAKDIIADIRAWDRLEGRVVHIDPATCAYGYRTSKFKTEWKGRYIITAVTYRLSRDPQPRLDYGGLRKALNLKCVDLVHGKSGLGAISGGGPGPGSVPQNAPEAIVGGPGPGDKKTPRPESGWTWSKEVESLTPELIRQTIIDIRNAKLPDPAVTGSAGSFFCNPVISREHFERIKDIARQDNGPDYQVPHFEVGDQIKVPAAWMIEQCGFKGKRLGGAQVYQNQPLVIVNASGEASPEEIIGLETEVIQAIESKYGITLHPEVEHI